ncbi:unnamed protein product, partial [Gulo gulo]
MVLAVDRCHPVSLVTGAGGGSGRPRQLLGAVGCPPRSPGYLKGGKPRDLPGLSRPSPVRRALAPGLVGRDACRSLGSCTCVCLATRPVRDAREGGVNQKGQLRISGLEPLPWGNSAQEGGSMAA